MNQMIKRFTLLIGMIVTTMPFLLSCGDITSTPGQMTFSPETLSIKSSNTNISKQNILLNVLGNNATPIQGTEVRLHMLLHNHVPFNNAAGVVAFLDADGNPEVITSPNNSTVQGTVLSKKSDDHGNISFSIQFPLGADYAFEVVAFGARTTAKLTVSVATNATTKIF